MMAAGSFAKPPRRSLILSPAHAGPALLFLALNAAAVAPAQPSPDQAKVLESARASALTYSSKLPDFVCTQTTHRSSWNPSEAAHFATGISAATPLSASPSAEADTMGHDITEQVTYFDQKESYQVIAVDGRKVSGVTHLQLQGAMTAGEFGSALHDVFDPASKTAFSQGKLTHLHHHQVWEFAFHVPSEHGNIVLLTNPDRETEVPYSGEVFIDPDTLDVVRIHSTLDLPAGFQLQHGETTVDYRPILIAGRKYNLPFHSEVRLADTSRVYVNTIDFRRYHKYVAESRILGVTH